MPEGAAYVLVHDAARPLVPPEVVDRVVAALRAGADGVVPALPLADTVKRVGPDGSVAETLDRSALRAVQTPQGFPLAVLREALARRRRRRDRLRVMVERLGAPSCASRATSAPSRSRRPPTSTAPPSSRATTTTIRTRTTTSDGDHDHDHGGSALEAEHLAHDRARRAPCTIRSAAASRSAPIVPSTAMQRRPAASAETTPTSVSSNASTSPAGISGASRRWASA